MYHDPMHRDFDIPAIATPYSVYLEDEVTSTQDLASQRLGAAPVLVVAHRQTAGRGRSGDAWLNAPRALAASLAIPSSGSEEQPSLISLRAGVAAVEVLDAQATGNELLLKWPNDLLIGERKVGGILAESNAERVVIGWGLNLYWPEPPDGFGAVYTDDPGPGEAEMIARLWADRLLVALAASVFDPNLYRNRSATIGRDVTWTAAGRPQTGRAIDIDDDGALLVESEGRKIRLNSGEVRHLRS